MEGKVETISSTCWYVQGQVHGIPTDLLIDSGSTYTILDVGLYETIPKDKRPALEHVDLILRSANGQQLHVHGQATIQLEIGNEVFESLVKVVSLGDRSAILGLDFMGEEECVLYMGKGVLQIGSKSLRVRLHKQTDAKCARVQVQETICIPGNHEVMVPGIIRQRHRNFDEAIGTLEPTQTLCETKGLVVARAVVRNDSSRVPVRIANFGPEPILLDKGHTIAMIHPVDPESMQKVESVEQIDESSVPEHLLPLAEQVDSELTREEQERVKKLLVKYQDCFMEPDGKLGKTSLVKHKIDTGDSTPIKQRFRNPPVHLREQVDKEIDRMLDTGEIEPSSSPWSSPLVIVKKKDGSIRVCVDYRKLNDCTKKDAYPLPKIEECLDSLSGAKWFCTLDLQSGYHQVGMDEEDKLKTAFSTRRGLFQFTVLPFGLSNAPAVFERLMELVLNGLQWERCILYLDDVICFGKSFNEALSNLELVLQRFKDANLRLKPSKCKLFQRSVEFLGHIVSDKGVSCDPKKIEAVQDWERPQCVKDVRSFVGFAQYYRKFIRNFSAIATPLYELTKKKVKFQWSQKCEEAFQLLKRKLVEAPILAYPTREDTFILDTDASLFGIGAVLSQQQNGEERVIAYASKTLSSTQRNYCTTMRELLAVVVFIKQFHHYLWGRPFIVRTDHASLTWLVNFREPAGMLARWISVLGNYDFQTEHRKGNLHGNADGLSRQIPRKCKREDCHDCALERDACVCAITRSQTRDLGEGLVSTETDGENPSGMAGVTDTQEVQVDSSEEVSLSTAEKCGSDQGRSGPVNAQVEEGTAKQSGHSGPAFCNASQPNWFEGWAQEEIKDLQQKDPVISEILLMKEERNDPPDKEALIDKDHELKILCGQWDKLEVQDEILYRRWTPMNTSELEHLQIVAPLSLRKEILHLLHSHKSAAHLGVTKTLKKLRQRFYWPGHKADVERWCKQCIVCESLHVAGNPRKAPLQPKPVYQRMDRVACDIMGPLPETKEGNQYILCVADHFSKYTEAYAIPDMLAQTVADKIVNEWVARYGCPVTIHTDQGRNFESELFKEICRLLDIHKTRTARYRPNSDAVVERNNRTLKRLLRACVDGNQKEWDYHLPFVMMAYRATIHETTKCSPNLLLFGCENRLPIDVMYADCALEHDVPECPSKYVEWIRATSRNAFAKARQHLKQGAERHKRYYDRNTFLREFKVGDWVWVLHPPEVQSKLGRGWTGPFLVVRRLGNVNYVVQDKEQGRKITLHVDHMKNYTHTTPKSWLQETT